MFASCVHPMAVLNAAFCMTCSLLMLVEDARGDHSDRSGLCACTEMLCMCVLYVSFGSKIRPITFGCVAMRSAVLFIFRSRFLLYSAGSGVNRVQVYFFWI